MPDIRTGDPEMHHGRPETCPVPELKVLLVEDNIVNQKLTTLLLGKKGWQVTVAADGREALAVFSPGMFDLVLMDVQMPVMDGYQTTAKIREMERERGGHIPIIAMTANALTGDKEKCLKSGMDGYISKPAKADELYHVIEDVLFQKNSLAKSLGPKISGDTPADLTQLMINLDGNKDLLNELIRHVLTHLPEELAAIHQAVSEYNPQALERCAHRFKGELANFGAARICALAQELEIMGKESRLESAESVFQDLATAVTAFETFFSDPARIDEL